MDDKIPLISDFVTIANMSRARITCEEIEKTEGIGLCYLNWNLNVATPYHFLKSFTS